MTVRAPETLPGFEGFPLHEALEHTGLSVMVADLAGRITLLSPAVRELFQAPAEVQEVELDDPRPGLGPIHLDGSPMAPEQTPLGRALQGEFVKNVVLGAHAADGSLIWLECNAIPLRDADGTLVGGAVLLQDVTAQRLADAVEDELRSRVVHAVNHEFRTPLAALLGNLEVVRDHHSVSGELSESLLAIERAAWRLCHLVGAAADLIEKQQELSASTPDEAVLRAG